VHDGIRQDSTVHDGMRQDSAELCERVVLYISTVLTTIKELWSKKRIGLC
jgi:hypothetical protein